ncbi:AraC family transcriptional regulator [Spirillospora sp. NPDC029432]|uniref:helix-turn-helix domain-containing protein n=1 Tax=Spirillospora sp. NPDC029432 TaxID=3154599 RepID=UPI003455F81F
MTPPPLSETCCGRTSLWLWPGHALYNGPALDLDMHSGAVACLAVGLDDPFTIDIPHRPTRTARSALIAPRTRHRLVAQGRMVFCYFDPSSPRRGTCADQMTAGDAVLGLNHADERRLLHFRPTQNWLDLAAPPGPIRTDPRIDQAIATLRAQVHRMVSAEELARGCGLSVSRFLHLFAAHTGTSFRRYRLWTRMLRAAQLVAENEDLTTAATEAGFATPSHFSDAFHRMFGLQPSRLLATGATIVVIKPAPAPATPAATCTKELKIRSGRPLL